MQPKQTVKAAEAFGARSLTFRHMCTHGCVTSAPAVCDVTGNEESHAGTTGDNALEVGTYFTQAFLIFILHLTLNSLHF